ncbi:MAG: DinB family protein [Dehalococcoidia bacterium]
MTDNDVARLLEQFRASRSAFVGRLDQIPLEDRGHAPAPGTWSAREIVIAVAAWLDEANDRIPRLLAGAPEVEYNRAAFNEAALDRAGEWSYEQARGALRRAADRYDMMIAESTAAEIAAEPPVMRWIACLAETLMEQHAAALDQLIATFDTGSTER